MAVCEICKKTVIAPSLAKLDDGGICCKKCAAKVAAPFYKGADKKTVELVKQGIDYQRKVEIMKLCERFRASDIVIGRMHLDSVNGIIVFCENGDLTVNGCLKRPIKDIYHILTLANFGFKWRKISNKDYGLCFKAFLLNYGIQLTEIVEAMPFGSLAVTDLARVEAELNLCNSRQIKDINENFLPEKTRSPSKNMLKCAEELFELGGTYTVEDIERQKVLLLNLLPSEEKKIMEAYTLLVKHIN